MIRQSIARQISLHIHDHNDTQTCSRDWLAIFIWIGIVAASLTAWIAVVVVALRLRAFG